MSIPAYSHGHGAWGCGANWILLPPEVRPPESAAHIARRLLLAQRAIATATRTPCSTRFYCAALVMQQASVTRRQAAA